MGRVNVDYSMSVLGLQTDLKSRSRHFRLPPLTRGAVRQARSNGLRRGCRTRSPPLLWLGLQLRNKTPKCRVELELPPIAFDPGRFSCRHGLPTLPNTILPPMMVVRCSRQQKRDSHIDPPTSSYAIMRRVHPYRGENPEPGTDVHGELDPTPGIREQPRPKHCFSEPNLLLKQSPPRPYLRAALSSSRYYKSQNSKRDWRLTICLVSFVH